MKDNHVYDGFGSLQNKNRFICKSEINRKTAREMCLPDFISIEYIKKAFDELPNKVYVRRGNLSNKNQTRVTAYVNKFELYNYIIKGRYIKK